MIQLLDHVIRNGGWGAIRTAERAAGKRNSWWHGTLRQGDLKLSDSLALLDHLGLEEGAFLRRGLGTDGEPPLSRPVGDPPPLVTRVRERLGRPLGDPGLGPAFLEALD
ncbi:MAG: hypothetical protein KDD47_06030, partial [Acidobacteria bacterium]|nr:hypothetical protein [Acidobacteriota bacterium]